MIGELATWGTFPARCRGDTRRKAAGRPTRLARLDAGAIARPRRGRRRGHQGASGKDCLGVEPSQSLRATGRLTAGVAPTSRLFRAYGCVDTDAWRREGNYPKSAWVLNDKKISGATPEIFCRLQGGGYRMVTICSGSFGRRCQSGRHGGAGRRRREACAAPPWLGLLGDGCQSSISISITSNLVLKSISMWLLSFTSYFLRPLSISTTAAEG